MSFDPSSIPRQLQALRPAIDAHITPERVRRYLKALAETLAPSTAASAMRTPVLKQLLAEDGVLSAPGLRLHENYQRTGSTVILTGAADGPKPLWFFTHLDTISYLVQPLADGRHPLVPFCYHLTQEGTRFARAFRFDLATCAYRVIAEGMIESEQSHPFFRAYEASVILRPGDRVVPFSPYREEKSGALSAHVDNAGGVAALAVAAPVIATAGVGALLAFPDEEEGPRGSGSQVMGRGASRIISLLPPPDLAIVADVHQAGGEQIADAGRDAVNTTELGKGAILAEFSSLARGAVTPPHLYALAQAFRTALIDVGVSMQESNNGYTSRSDDVSVLLKTPNILLFGFPGFNRHYDRGEPRAHLRDIVDLAKALAYGAVLHPLYCALQAQLVGAAL